MLYMNLLMKSYMWKLKRIPNKHMVVECKWIFKGKNSGIEELRNKARLVIKRFNQVEEIKTIVDVY